MNDEELFKKAHEDFENAVAAMHRNMAEMKKALNSISHEDHRFRDHELWDKIQNKRSIRQCNTEAGDMIIPSAWMIAPQHRKFRDKCTSMFYDSEGRRKFCDKCHDKKQETLKLVNKERNRQRNLAKKEE